MAGKRIYTDTSVLGGCFDLEFAEWSNGLVDDFRRGVFQPVLSDVTAEEISRAPERVRAVHQELASLGAEILSVSPEVLQLVVAYEARAILGPKYRNDLLHIALATVAAVDVLVSLELQTYRAPGQDSAHQRSECRAQIPFVADLFPTRGYDLWLK